MAAHLARPDPLWPALEANPAVLLSVVDDAFIPAPWQAPGGVPPEHSTPTSFSAAVQLHCTAHIVDDPEEKAELRLVVWPHTGVGASAHRRQAHPARRPR
ncbi:FMN-binding negative transcriptional regulator [Streptomyces sp. 205]|uniref:FMN-binding negative transcriptional regulator n=1 Tax=Streptomyces coffeae TaxID=621382 RepID=A0ABS1NKW5_9ACTN|nr:FMN-binding negative transcriptional regulator [Streptomyces coffeae]